MALPWYRVHTVVLNDPGRLIAGKIIEFFNKSIKQEKSLDFYLTLLKNQYLSN